jgi:hypothetical protein
MMKNTIKIMLKNPTNLLIIPGIRRFFVNLIPDILFHKIDIQKTHYSEI